MHYHSGTYWSRLPILALIFNFARACTGYVQPLDFISSNLYGEWKFRQVCSSDFSGGQLVASDHKIYSLYNGSLLSPLDGSSKWPVIMDKLEEANELGLLSRQRLGVICSMAAWDYADPTEEKLSNEPHRDDGTCLKQLSNLHNFVKNLIRKTAPANVEDGIEMNFSLDLWQQFHSFGRLPSGPPYKEHLLPGDFDGCARLEKTRYCLGAYGHSSDSKTATGDRRNSHLIGLCLPKSCSSKFLRHSKMLMDKLNSLLRWNMPSFLHPRTSAGREVWELGEDEHSGHLTDVFCPPATDSSYRKLLRDELSVVLVILLLLWAFTLLYATYFRKWFWSEKESDATLKSFDLTENWSKFLDSSHLDERLVGLNGFKVLAMIWLMTTHLSMTIFPYVKNLNELYAYYMSTAHGPVVLQGQHCVPLFFIISGVIFGFKYLNRPTATDTKHLIVWRYFRLMPMYLLAYAYIRKFAHLAGDGPLWDSGVSQQSEVRQCLLESWLVPVLMVSNFKAPFSHCLITGWHISNDAQIYLALPLLLLAYRSSQGCGTRLALCAFIATHLSHMWFWGTADNYDLGQLMKDPVRYGPHYILNRLALDYVNPLGRLGTFFIGVHLANLLLERQREHQDRRSLELRQPKQRAHEGKQVASEEVSALVGRRQETEKALDARRCQADARADLSGRDSLIDPATPNRLISPSGQADASVTICKADGGQGTTISDKDNERARERFEWPRSGARERSSAWSLARADQNSWPLTNFKDKLWLALGVCLLVFGLFSVFIPPDGPLTKLLGPMAKAVGYPLCRLLVELGWSIVLYYFLLTNLPPPPPAASDSKSLGLEGRRARAAGAERRDLLMKIDKDGKLAADKRVQCNSSAGSRPPLPARDDKEAQSFPIAALKWPIWNVLVKANYAVMLTHYALFRSIVQSQRELFLFTWFNFLQLLALLLVLSYLIGVLVHLAIEIPLTSLVRLFVARFVLARSSRRAPSEKFATTS